MDKNVNLTPLETCPVRVSNGVDKNSENLPAIDNSIRFWYTAISKNFQLN